MVSPTTGIIVYRNIFPGLKFIQGQEFFRIADLSRVWILADVFEGEDQFLKPGQKANDHAGQPEAVLRGDRQPHPAAFRPREPDAQGAPRGGEPRLCPPARHVRRRRGARPVSAVDLGPGGRGPGFGTAQDGFRRARRGSVRAPRGRDRLAPGRPGGDHRGARARGEDRPFRHLPHRFGEPDGPGRGRDGADACPVPRERRHGLGRQGGTGRTKVCLQREDLLFLHGRGQSRVRRQPPKIRRPKPAPESEPEESDDQPHRRLFDPQ